MLLSRPFTSCICTKKRSLSPRRLCPPCGAPRRPRHPEGPCQSTGCAALRPAKKRQPKPRRSAAISDSSPHSTRARVTRQESFHRGTAVPSASRPARSHQPAPSALIFCFANNLSHLILASHLVYTLLNQQQNLQAGPATTSLVTTLHCVGAPLGGKLQEPGCLLQGISASHTSHGEAWYWLDSWCCYQSTKINHCFTWVGLIQIALLCISCIHILFVKSKC